MRLHPRGTLDRSAATLGCVYLLVLVGLLTAALTAAPAPETSPTLGVAYDLVVKLQAIDPTKYTRETFDEDFRVASEAEGPQLRFLGPQRRLATTGVAERHYLTSSKERVDNLTLGTAAILDCSARTITRLDLLAKTYAVQSYSEPSPAPSRPTTPFAPSDNGGTELSFVSETKALGTRNFGNIATDGYRIDEIFSFEIPRINLQVHKLEALRFYTQTVLPRLDCSGSRRARLLMSPVETSRGYKDFSVLNEINRNDPSVKITRRGPAMPDERLALVEIARTEMQSDGYTVSVATTIERGHIRPILPIDSIFDIPSDFALSLRP
jgi:hypothetical protein